MPRPSDPARTGPHTAPDGADRIETMTLSKTDTETLDRFAFWTLDTIAECVEGITAAGLYGVLWDAMVEDDRNVDGDYGRDEYMTGDPNRLEVAFERLHPETQLALLRVLRRAE